MGKKSSTVIFVSSGISKLVILTQSSVDFGDQEYRAMILGWPSCFLEILPREVWLIPEFIQKADVGVNACPDAPRSFRVGARPICSNRTSARRTPNNWTFKIMPRFRTIVEIGGLARLVSISI